MNSPPPETRQTNDQDLPALFPSYQQINSDLYPSNLENDTIPSVGRKKRGRPVSGGRGFEKKKKLDGEEKEEESKTGSEWENTGSEPMEEIAYWKGENLVVDIDTNDEKKLQYNTLVQQIYKNRLKYGQLQKNNLVHQNLKFLPFLNFKNNQPETISIDPLSEGEDENNIEEEPEFQIKEEDKKIIQEEEERYKVVYQNIMGEVAKIDSVIREKHQELEEVLNQLKHIYNFNKIQ